MPPALLHGLRDRLRDRASVERLRAKHSDRAQRAREVRLHEARLRVHGARREVDARGLGEARRHAARAERLDDARLVRADLVALVGESDRGRHHLAERARPEALLREREARDQPRRADREPTDQRGVFGYARPQIHVWPRGGGCRLARVDRDGAPVREADQEKAAAADPGGLWLRHREREGSGDGRVHRVPARAEQLDARLAHRRVRAHHERAHARRRRGRDAERGLRDRERERGDESERRGARPGRRHGARR